MWRYNVVLHFTNYITLISLSLQINTNLPFFTLELDSCSAKINKKNKINKITSYNIRSYKHYCNCFRNDFLLCMALLILYGFVIKSIQNFKNLLIIDLQLFNWGLHTICGNKQCVPIAKCHVDMILHPDLVLSPRLNLLQIHSNYRIKPTYLDATRSLLLCSSDWKPNWMSQSATTHQGFPCASFHKTLLLVV